MGNLNCFESKYRKPKAHWFDEWQNNSSYPYPYEYYDREYYNNFQLQNQQLQSQQIPQDPDMINYYYNNGISTGCTPQQQYLQENYDVSGHISNSGSNQYQDPNFQLEVESDSKDDAQEAFMSDWLAREEAELNSKVKTLQNTSKDASIEIKTKRCKIRDEDELSDSKKSEKKVSKRKHKKKKHKKHKKHKNYNIDKDCTIESSSSTSSSSSSSTNSSSDSEMIKIESKGKVVDSKIDAVMGFSNKKSGKCCYTAFIMCNSSGEWDNFLKKTARFMTGLQRQFQCIIKFSDKISFHRGNSVRTFQIIGPHKGSVIRCKAALPKAVAQLLITPLTGSAEVEEYSRECNFARFGAGRRNLLPKLLKE